MTQRKLVIRRAGRRLLVNDAIRHSAWCVLLGFSAFLALVIAERVFGAAIPWNIAAWALPAVAAVGAVAWTILARRDHRAIALCVDERAELREALSTSLLLEGKDDPWSRNVVEATETRAAGVDVRAAVPIETPKAWPMVLGMGIAALVCFLALPQWDIFGRSAARDDRDRAESELRLVRDELKAEQKKLDDLLEKAGIKPEPSELPDAAQTPETKTPEEERQAILKQLTALSQKMQEQGASPETRKQEALQEALRQLQNPGEGELSETARKLARGDMNAAKKALEEVSKKLQDGSLSESEKQQLTQQAENLAKQLQQMAQGQKPNQQQLEQAMQQAGMSQEQAQQLAQQLAQNPGMAQQLMQQAMQQMQNMSPQQQQQLQQMAAQMQASQQMQQMGDQMQQMAEKMQQGDPSACQGMCDSMGQMGQQQSDAQAGEQAREQAMAQLEKMMSQAGGQPGSQSGAGNGDPQIGQWAAGDDKSQGNGSGGPGHGNGASTPDTPAPTRTHKEIAKSQDTGKGPIIASEVLEGESDIGESHAEFVAAVEAAQQAASEAFQEQIIPRDRQELVKRYFSTMKRRTLPTTSGDK